MTINGRVPRRILHTSDIHLIAPGDIAWRSFEAMAELAINSKADLVIIAGDFFDAASANDKLLKPTIEQLRRLPPTVILPGNHDCAIPDSVYLRKDATPLWANLPNVRLLLQPGGENLILPELNVSVWGNPITSYLDDMHPMAGVPDQRHDGLWYIAVAHGFVDGDTEYSPRSFPIDRHEITRSNRDYIALGHMPLYNCVCDEPVKAYYSGSPSISGSVNIIDLNDSTGVKVTRYMLDL